MDWMPHINWIEPEEERDAAWHISIQIVNLNRYVDEFASALSLYDHIDAMKMSSLAADPEGERIDERAALARWLMIPASHAALTVYHFQSTLRSLRDRLQYTPTLAAKVDSKKLQIAYDRFDEEFPSWRYVRDWVAHTADKIFKPELIEEHRKKDGPFVHQSMGERGIVFTRQGEYISLPLTEDNLERLRSIKQDAYLAFRKASAWPPPD